MKSNIVKSSRTSTSLQLDPSYFATMTAAERLICFEALKATAETTLGFLNQPRCYTDDGENNNAAGRFLEDLLEVLSRASTFVEEAAKGDSSSVPKEVETNAWLLLMVNASYADGLPRFAALAAELVAKVASAELHARRTETVQ